MSDFVPLSRRLRISINSMDMSPLPLDSDDARVMLVQEGNELLARLDRSQAEMRSFVLSFRRFAERGLLALPLFSATMLVVFFVDQSGLSPGVLGRFPWLDVGTVLVGWTLLICVAQVLSDIAGRKMQELDHLRWQWQKSTFMDIAKSVGDPAYKRESFK